MILYTLIRIPTDIKQTPKAISKLTSDISSSKEICNQNISYYKDDLKHNGYDNISLPYSPRLEQAQDKIEKEIRKSKIIWFSPTFSMSVKRNVDNTFFKFLQRHFPKRHLMHKIFNRKTVKISYCCM